MSGSVTILVVALLTSTACTLAGLFLVLRRMAMMADAISHSVLPGLILGYVLAHGPNVWFGMAGAMLSGLTTVWLVEWIKRARLVKDDTAIGLVFPTMFSVGVYVISTSFRNVHLDTDAVLYGTIELAPLDTIKWGEWNLGPQSIYVLAFAIGVTAIALWSFNKELQFSTFDAESAEVAGIHPHRLHFALMGIVAMNTVAAFSAVGAILTIALTVVPIAIAYQCTRRLVTLLWIALASSWLCSFAGFWIAYQADVSIGGTMATLLGGLFLVAIFWAPRYGLVPQIRFQKRQRMEFAVQTLVGHLINHEHTDHAQEECDVKHLEGEFGWTPKWVQAVVSQARARHWVILENDGLAVTPEGRAALVQSTLGRIGVPISAAQRG